MAAIAQNTQDHSKRRVAYYYDANIGNYYYGQGHVMKPQRIRMTHSLLLNYGIYKDLDVYRPFPASFDEMTRFHTDEYVTFLKNATEYERTNKDVLKFHIDDDCPIFDGLYEFCQLSSGGSLAAAVKLNKQKADIAINWMGGLHHAKKGEASGFCYTNDIVLGILELLKYHKRVLYVDIDVHHGDGVEEAFCTTDRVMTVSFHKYDGDFFPKTGTVKEIGHGAGRLYSINVPLKDGIRDDHYQSIFKPVMTKVMEKYQPEAIVLQCGADSLNGDKLGPFNLTIKGHGECVSFLRSYNIPMMMVGGGGYTPKNVARCWTYETALALNKEIPNELPYNDYYDYFGPDYRLHIPQATTPNHCTRDYLRRMEEKVLRNLDEMPAVPSVQMQPIPADAIQSLNDLSLQLDLANPDIRLHASTMDPMIMDQGEFFDGEEEGDDGRNTHNAKEEEEGERRVKRAKMEEDEEERKKREQKDKREREETEKKRREQEMEVKRRKYEIERKREETAREEKEKREREMEEKKKREREMVEKKMREKEEKEKKEKEEKKMREREENEKKDNEEKEKREREKEEKEKKEKEMREREEKEKREREIEEKKRREKEEKEKREREIEEKKMREKEEKDKKENEEKEKREREKEEKERREKEETEKKEKEEKEKREKEDREKKEKEENDKRENEEKEKREREVEEEKRREKEEKEKKEKDEKDKREREIEENKKKAEEEKKKHEVVELTDDDPTTVEPSEIKWDFNVGQKKLIKILNHSTDRKAVKVKCSDIRIFEFDPVFTFVDPGKTVKIRVTRNSGATKKDKAVIMLAKCRNSDEDSAAIFRATPLEQQEKHTVAFIFRKPRGTPRGSVRADPIELD